MKPSNEELIERLDEELTGLSREVERLCKRSVLLRETRDALQQAIVDARRLDSRLRGNDGIARPTAADLMETMRPEEVGPKVRSARTAPETVVNQEPTVSKRAPDWAMNLLKGGAPMPAADPPKQPTPRRTARSGSTPNVDRVAEYLAEHGPSSCVAIAAGLSLEYQLVYNALTGRFWERFQKVNGIDGKVWALRAPAEVSAEKEATHG